MRRKFLRTLAIVFSATVAVATSGNTIATATEAVTEETEVVLSTEMTDEEIDNAVVTLKPAEIAEWLSELEYKDYRALLERDTLLTSEIVSETYETVENDGEEITLELSETETEKFHEYALKLAELPAPAPAGAEKADYFGNKTGYFYYKYQLNGTQTGYNTISISGLDTTTAVTTAQKPTVKISLVGYVPGGSMVFGHTSGAQVALKSVSDWADSGSKSKILLRLYSKLSVSQGYAIAVGADKAGTGMFDLKAGNTTYPNMSTYSGNYNFAQAKSDALTTYTSLTLQSTVGKKNENGSISAGYASSYIFNIIPAGYYLQYAGNGATGGSEPARQLVNYDTSANIAQNSFERAFTVSFDLNDQDNPQKPASGAENQTVKSTFTGWKGSNGATYKPGQTVKNLTTTNGAAIILSAQWQDNTLTLPTPTRKGYTFTGWTKEGDSEATDKESVTVNSNMKFIAGWKQNLVDVTVEHYIQRAPKGAYELFSAEVLHDLPEDATYAFPLNQFAIDEVNKIEGHHCVRPSVQSATPTEGLVIKYYYDCEKDAVDPVTPEEPADPTPSTPSTPGNTSTTNVYNTYGLSKAEVLSFFDAIKNGLGKLTIDNVTYTVVKNSDGTYSIHNITTSSQPIVTIPATIKLGNNTYTIAKVADGAFKNNTTVKQVYISSGITSIGAYAFYNCKNLEKASMPDSIMKIGKYAFAKCPKLKSVAFSKNCYEMGEGVFSGDKALKKINLTSKLTNVPKTTFKNCSKLASVTFGSRIRTIGSSAFEGCKALKSIKLPTKLEKINSKAFYNCSKLSKVTFKGKKLSKVGSKAFKKCGKNIIFKVPSKTLDKYKKVLKGKY